jgi:hypothetical protein
MSESCGGRNRTRNLLLNRETPYRLATPQKWAGRRSNPRLLVFSQVLHRLSYRPFGSQPAAWPPTALCKANEQGPMSF